MKEILESIYTSIKAMIETNKLHSKRMDILSERIDILSEKIDEVINEKK